MDELGPEAVAAVRTAAQAAAEAPSRERLDTLARALDVLARHDAERSAYRLLVARLAALEAPPGMTTLAELISTARALLAR